MRVFAKRIPKQLPDHCDLCHDKIGRYEPWYTVVIDSHFSKDKEHSETVFCSGCYLAYCDFLVERQVLATHIREMKETRV